MDTAASAGLAGVTAVPEPATGVIVIVIASAALLPRGRRRRFG
jgi:hypothetical protein